MQAAQTTKQNQENKTWTNECNKEIEIIRTKPKKYALKIKLSSRNEGERRKFPDKQKLREFITTSPALQEIPKSPSSSNERTLTSWKQNSLVKVNI